jgi:hypothetical protein
MYFYLTLQRYGYKSIDHAFNKKRMEKKNKKVNETICFHKLSYLRAVLVRIFPAYGEAIKRESGENPEQSRCCKS